MASIRRHKNKKGMIERKICIACIVSDVVLSRVSKIYSSQLITSKNVDEIINWCVTYFKKYGKAPREVIQDVFESKIRKSDDEEKIELLSTILELCSKEFQREKSDFNDQYYLDTILDYFSERSLHNLSDDIKAELMEGNLAEAEKAVVQYRKVQAETDTSINPFTDADEIHDAFETIEEPLLSFKGAYGELVAEDNFRGSLVSLLAPEKRGKTWMLQEYAFASLRARCNTVFFSVGDMSKKEMTIRHSIRLTGKSNKKRYCKEILIPVMDCLNNQEDVCRKKVRKNREELGIEPNDILAGEFDFEDANPKYKPCHRNCKDCKSTFWYKKRPQVEPLTWREAYRAGQKFFKRMRGRNYKIESFPNSSASVYDLDNRLALWEETEGFIPDVVVIDYADILAPEPNTIGKDPRYQINETWKALKRLAQKWHCLVVTATQADANSYTQDRLNQTNFSEDKRKLSHVNAMYGLNQSFLEKRLGIMRVNEIVKREGEFYSDREVKLLQSLACGRPLLGSFW